MNNHPVPVLECKNLCKTFKEGSLTTAVLHGINLQVMPGEQVAIVGSSGAGKSTLLHLIGGLDKPTSGEVFINGQNIHQLSEKKRSHLRNQCLGFVYQFHHLLPEFTALENVAMPLLIRKIPTKYAKAEAKLILEKVGLGHRLQHKLAELSGGERQRTAIARALVLKPICVLADEPTGNLDAKTAEQVYNTMLALNREMNTSIVIVTHDQHLASKMDRILLMEDGRFIS